MNEFDHFETLAVRHQTERGQREHSVPLYLTSSFVFEDAEQARAMFADEVPGNIYSRFSNPNNEEFVEKMCLLEGAPHGVSFASGMAAVFCSMAALLKSGDHIVSSRALFGSTHQILTKLFPRWGIEFTYVDAAAPVEAWRAAIRPNTKMIYAETPSNPGLEVTDLAMLAAVSKEHNLILNIDNCFATPYLQKPMALGADIVVHSATKYIDGQGRGIGGVAVGKSEYIKEIRYFARQTGPALSPFNGWMFSKSLETLAVRMDRHCHNAAELARALDGHPELEEVRYPFLPSHPQYELSKRQMTAGGGMVCFVVRGGYERGRRFLGDIRMCSHTANLGDSRTIVTHPASTTHAKLTEDERAAVAIRPGLIRVSTGLEHIDDIKADILQALEKSQA